MNGLGAHIGKLDPLAVKCVLWIPVGSTVTRLAGSLTCSSWASRDPHSSATDMTETPGSLSNKRRFALK